MNILLTGATGFLGYRTLERLIEMRSVESIIANGRKIKNTHHVAHKKVQYELGDLSDMAFVESMVARVDCIIHAAALSSPWGTYALFEKANIQSQQNLIAAAKKYGIQRFIYISTPSVYFDFTDKLNIKESDPLPAKFVNDYAKTKRMAEIQLQASNLPFVILRPRALTGRGDTVIMPRLVRAFDEGRLKIIGNGKNWVDLTSVSNVVDAILLSLIARENALNEIYNISNGEPVLLWEKIEIVLEKLGRKLPKKKVPAQIVQWLAGFMEAKSRLFNKEEPALTKYGVGTLTMSFTMDISKARRLLNYSPKTNTDQAIHEFVQWYNEKS